MEQINNLRLTNAYHARRTNLRFILYLLFPRSNLLFATARAFFFLTGFTVGLTKVGVPDSKRWLAVFFLFEVVIGHGKYLINDLMGRTSDRFFLRARTNQFPKQFAGISFVLFYAAIRYVLGVWGLFLVGGISLAFLSVLILALQLTYELVKLSVLSTRGQVTFCIVCFGYGVKSVAGLLALDESLFFSSTSAVLFAWGTMNGAIFLSTYWCREGEFYLKHAKVNFEILRRYKPGVCAVYTKSPATSERLRTWTDSLLLVGLIVLVLRNLSLFFYKGSMLGLLLSTILASCVMVYVFKREDQNYTSQLGSIAILVMFATVGVDASSHSLVRANDSLLTYPLLVLSIINHVLMQNVPDTMLWGSDLRHYESFKGC